MIGLNNAQILHTVLYVGLGFVGYSLVGGGKLSKLERKIQQILFPTIELEFKDYCAKRCMDLEDRKAWQRWTNKKCDVLALWSHIWHDGDIFITSDSNFHKETKKPKLVNLGAKEILTPRDALEFLVNNARETEASLSRTTAQEHLNREPSTRTPPARGDQHSMNMLSQHAS